MHTAGRLKYRILILLIAITFITAAISGCSHSYAGYENYSNENYYNNDTSGYENYSNTDASSYDYYEEPAVDQSKAFDEEEIVEEEFDEEEIKESIAKVLLNSNIEDTSISNITKITVGDILMYMFTDYSMTYNRITRDSYVYAVKISGKALLNPELREWADTPGVTADTYMTFNVDIENNTCALISDPDNIYMLYFSNYG